MGFGKSIIIARKIAKTVLPAIAIICLSVGACLGDHWKANQLLASAIDSYHAVESYTCKLDKRVRKNGRLYEDVSVRVKFKKPANYYFRWESGPRRGREVIFVAGRNNDKIVAHPGGMLRFMTFRLSPDGHLAMEENRHSLRNSGIGKIMQIIESDYHRSQQMGLKTVRFAGKAHVDDRSTWVLEGRFPKNRGFYARRVVLYLDQSLSLPIKVTIYDGSNTLTEEYIFRHLIINVPFSDSDFDPGNPAYDFF